MLQVVLAACLFAFIVFMYHWRDTTKYSSEIARRLLPQNLLLGLVYILAFNVRGLLAAFFFTAFALVAWLIWLRHILRNPAAGELLLRWKRTRSTSDIVSVVILVLFGVLLMVLGLTRQPVDAEEIYISLLFISLVPIVYFEKDPRLTENGIDTGRDYVYWEQIESYRWSRYDETITHIFFKTNRRLPIVNFVKLTLPLEQKEAVNEIVSRKMQHIAAITETTTPSV